MAEMAPRRKRITPEAAEELGYAELLALAVPAEGRASYKGSVADLRRLAVTGKKTADRPKSVKVPEIKGKSTGRRPSGTSKTGVR